MLAKLIKALKVCGKISPHMTATQLDFLLGVALNPGQGTTFHARRLRMAPASVSSLISRLGNRGRSRDGEKEPTLDLIEQRPAPRDARKKEVYLTDKGHTLMKEIANILIGPEGNS
jgi:DNA-binding MarR family transcriptional regulator